MAYAYDNNPLVPAVLPDDETSAYQMTRYLIQKGHRKIALLAGKEDNLHTQRRLKGYQNALYDAQILYNPRLVRYVDWNKPSGYQEAKRLLKEDITAVFCMSDVMAGGVYQYLDELGLRAGRDVSVVGFDNQELSEYMIPGLTTMTLPLKEIGTTSAKLLFDQIEKGEVEMNREILIPCFFVERDSVKEISNRNEIR